MDSASTLQAPRTGRSRFSKALPAPPPGLDDNPASIPRGLPSFPFPPRKDSVTTASSDVRSMKTEGFDFPLPPPPAKADASQIQSPKNVIQRRPVGLPAQKSKKMKRVSSISSLLSAYSNGSTDSVHRSSQDTMLTKDSEPSRPQGREEREGMASPKDLAQILISYSSNPYEDDSPSSRDEEARKPSPPSMSSLEIQPQPSIPQSTQPLETSQVGPVSTSSPVLLTNGSPKAEIWRRRAGSKSDVGKAVVGLKLAVSHGSTAAIIPVLSADASSQIHDPSTDVAGSETLSLPSGSDAQVRSTRSYATPLYPPQEQLLPQPQLPKGGDATLPPYSRLTELNSISSKDSTVPKSTSGTAEPNSTQTLQKNNEGKISTLAPRLTSLPGRNVRPRQQTAPEDDKATNGKDLGIRRELAPAPALSDTAPNDFLRVSPWPEPQKNLRGLPTSPRMDPQPSPSPAPVGAPKDQPTEQKSLPQMPHAITRKELPTPVHSPSNAQKRTIQVARSPAPPLTPPEVPLRESENPAVRQPASGAAAAESQLSPQPGSDAPDSRLAKGGPRWPVPESLAVGPPASRAAGVRPARSQSDLSSSTIIPPNYHHGKQDPTSKRISPTMGNPQSRDLAAGGNARSSPAQQSPSTTTANITPTPTADNMSLQGSDLFDLVTNLNLSSQETSVKDFAPGPGPGPTNRPTRTRPTLSLDSRPLSEIKEVPKDSIEMSRREGGAAAATQQDQELPEPSREANEALLRFPRGALEQQRRQPPFQRQPFANGVWAPRPLGRENYNCWTGHGTMVSARNTHYPLACQACGTEERSWRKVCSWCSLRVCYDCAALLAQNGGSLERMMDALGAKKRLEKGKERQDPTAAAIN